MSLPACCSEPDCSGTRATNATPARLSRYSLKVLRIAITRLRKSRSRKILRRIRRTPSGPSSRRLRPGESSAIGAVPTHSTMKPAPVKSSRHSATVSGRALTRITWARVLRSESADPPAILSGVRASSWIAYLPPGRSTRNASATIACLAFSPCIVSIASPITTSQLSDSSPVSCASRCRTVALNGRSETIEVT